MAVNKIFTPGAIEDASGHEPHRGLEYSTWRLSEKQRQSIYQDKHDYAVDGRGHQSSLPSLIRSLFFSALAALSICCVIATHSFWPLPTTAGASMSVLVKDAVDSSAPLLVDFQVYQPVLTPTDQTSSHDESCTVVLMVHDFGYSYGEPFIGSYTPPPCAAKSNRVSMNFTVTSRGRQFDRLGLMYLGDTEVFRTCTAEPTQNGIIWTYVKDMTHLFALWKQPQKIVFDLGNIVNSEYTGHFNTTLTATFFTTEVVVDPADAIIPISLHQSSLDSGSAFTLPPQNASNTVTFPRNVTKAVFSILASGGGAEEFWWGNVLQSDVNTFQDDPNVGVLYGYSPFRELQLFIDGKLAGVQWPFPIIFTGGVVPGLWRPIVGLDAFDLREHEIDITAWLPLLCDGAAAGHTFEILVAGIDDDGKGHGALTSAVGSDWTVTGKIFLWYDEKPGWITTGTHPVAVAPTPSIGISSSFTQNANGTNDTLTYDVVVSRHLSFTSTVITSKGPQVATWSQDLSFSNKGYYTDEGNVQVVDQSTIGTDVSSSGYKTYYSYPAWVNTTQWVDPSGSGNFTLDANMTRGLILEVDGPATFPTGLQSFTTLPSSKDKLASIKGSKLSTSQNGTAHYLGVPSQATAYGFGSTEQDFTFSGYNVGEATIELYKRHVLAVNATVISDEESLAGVTLSTFHPVSMGQKGEPVLLSVKAALGRGGGQLKPNLVDSNGGA